MNKRFPFLLAAATFMLQAQAQFIADVDTNLVSRIREEGLQHSQVMQHGFHITDRTGHRLTWSSGFDSAASWVINQFKEWGLQNIHKEFWEPRGKAWNIEKCYAALKLPYYQNLMCTPKAWSGSTQGPVNGTVILIKARDSTEFVRSYKGKLAGKILIFESAFPEPRLSFKPHAFRFTADTLARMAADTWPDTATLFSTDTAVMRNRLENLKNFFKTYFLSDQEWLWTFCRKQGALAILSTGFGDYGTYGTDGSYNYLYKPGNIPIANIALRMEDFLRINRLVNEGVKVSLDIDVKTSFKSQPQKGYNIVAEIAGTDPVLKNELVIIGGHFDSWHGATGATDNGAGSIVMIEVMRMLKTLNLPLKRTVRIVLWGGEEQGLLGSLAYVNTNVAQFSSMKPLRDYDRISAYYNLDNGSGRIRGINLQNNTALRPIFEKWLAPFKDLDGSTVSIHNSGYTDNEPFDLVGIPAFQFIQDELDYETRTHHTNSDTYERLSKDDLKQAATIIASLVTCTANSLEKLPRKPKPQPYGTFSFYLF